MKYLIITNHSYMFWQFRRELIEELLKKGEVVICTPFVGHEEDLISLGCRCIETDFERRGINPFDEIKLFKTYRKLLKKENPNLVITYSIKPNIYAGILCSHMNIPYCVNIQGLGTAFQSKMMAFLSAILYHVALKKARTVFFENTFNARFFVRRRIISADKVTRLRGAGVNLREYAYHSFPSEEKGIHFLYLGRIMREKGMEELFSAIRRIKAEYSDQVYFDFVGFFEDDYKLMVEKLEKEGLIRFHGFQENPLPYYANAHCVILPSWHEGMSNVLLEAAAVGRPVIASNIPGCREAVDEGESGFLCEVRDSNSLYHVVKNFLSLSEKEHEEMGIKGREKMKKEFNRIKVVKKTIRACRIV